MSKFTLKGKLLQHSLRALYTLQIPDLKVVVVGGIACQLYSVSPEFYRPTDDVDTMVSRPVSSQEFRDTLNSAISGYLVQQGYPTSLRKTRYGFEIASEEEGKTFKK